MNNIFKYQLLRKYVTLNLMLAIGTTVVCAVWLRMTLVKPTVILLLGVIPVILGTCHKVPQYIKRLYLLAAGAVSYIGEMSLEVTDGWITGQYILPTFARGTGWLFLRTSRDWIEGDIKIMEVTPSATKESVVSITRPRFFLARRNNYDPVELRLNSGENATLTLAFKLHRDYPYKHGAFPSVLKLPERETALLVVMRGHKPATARLSGGIEAQRPLN
jgi:hypothetical protein